ncbi:hypothetical protein D9M72_643380 [compost metagenome]
MALNTSATSANSDDSSIPANIASNTPNHRCPVLNATMKPITAPNSIMPSWPRLRTPLFSQISSPSATSSNGVPQRTMA